MTEPVNPFERDLGVAVRELQRVRAENRALVKDKETADTLVVQLKAQISALQAQVLDLETQLAARTQTAVTQLDDLTAVRTERDRLRQEVLDWRAGRIQREPVPTPIRATGDDPTGG